MVKYQALPDPQPAFSFFNVLIYIKKGATNYLQLLFPVKKYCCFIRSGVR